MTRKVGDAFFLNLKIIFVKFIYLFLYFLSPRELRNILILIKWN